MCRGSLFTSYATFFEFACLPRVCMVENCFQSNLWMLATWVAGRDCESCRLIAFLCSVIPEWLIVFDVSPI